LKYGIAIFEQAPNSAFLILIPPQCTSSYTKIHSESPEPYAKSNVSYKSLYEEEAEVL